MYSKNYVGTDAPTENISVPPDYSGNAIYRPSEQFRDQPRGEDGAPSYREIRQPPGEDGGAFDAGCECGENGRGDRNMPPYPPPPPPPPCRRSGLMDRFSSEDMIIFGAAALIVFGDQDDILSIAILILAILL